MLTLSVCLFVILFAALDSRGAVTSAQASDSAGKADKPYYHDYKGVQIGMAQEEARKKLGVPKEKDDAQDFYIFSDKETAQIFYRDKKVVALSVTYMGVKTDAPEAKAVFGADIQPGKDGRVYKMVRYPEAGFWVSYSRLSGDEPMVTVTMQKLQ
jgi:hypothetical protein